MSDQDKLRQEMLNQFKQDLEQTKKDLDIRYSQQLKQEIQKQVEKHKRLISETKKKQWVSAASILRSSVGHLFGIGDMWDFVHYHSEEI